ncbi:MAG: two-component regulator propeller domain-containing protein, partial [Cyanobacteria bacterium J06649_11]
ILRSVTRLRGKNVTSISFAKDKSVWVGTDNGLLRLNPYNGAVLDRVAGLPSSRIISIAPDVGNKLWVGTSEGLAWLMPTMERAQPHLAFTRAVW